MYLVGVWLCYNMVCLFFIVQIVHFLEKSVDVFSKSGLFSELTLRSHNLSYEGLISKLKDVYLVGVWLCYNMVCLFFIVHFLEKSVGY